MLPAIDGHDERCIVPGFEREKRLPCFWEIVEQVGRP